VAAATRPYSKGSFFNPPKDIIFEEEEPSSGYGVAAAQPFKVKDSGMSKQKY
jgi:hypothetical protein